MARILDFVRRSPAPAAPPGAALDGLLAGFSIEVMPRTASRIADFREILPAGTRVYLAHIDGTDFAEMKAMSAGKPGLLENLKSIPAAAATSVWAATATELDSAGGAYLADCAVGRASRHAVDPSTAEELWELSEQLVGR